MSKGADEPDMARKFLDSFLHEFPSPLGPEAPLPVSLQTRTLSSAEVEGEVMELALRLLGSRKAPLPLAAALTHAAVEEVLGAELARFAVKQTSEDEEEKAATLLDAESLQRFFLNELRQVSHRWREQPRPILMPEQPHLLVSVHAIRNTRRKMEDRHVAIPEFNQLFGIKDGEDRAYFAVFDGHGGVDAANYTATHLHVNLAHHVDFPKSPGKALQESFQCTDVMFLQKAKREKLRSGTTGVAALIVGDMLHIAWLGDSQVMLVRRGEAVTLMDPHKPDREDERERIEKLGGCVAYMGCWRVNGTLAVSRAIGDIDHKPYVSGDADGASFKLAGSEDYLLLACDGFFDAVQPCEVPALVLEHLKGSQGDGHGVAERLVAAAKHGGSSDNITVLVVFLRDPSSILADSLRPPQTSDSEERASNGLFSFFTHKSSPQPDKC
ncbi:hypothetical protein NDU88_006936 [Pleurodeles waltl]|uniref:Protein phosphatase 1F n=2 Tax=Pleurodeles waltl TaxID=8319 RepID=A0AAV7LRV9_PLEWA|nr:hypothetical protein NDU88_006936 [Pleurodeles waltl]